MLASSWLCCRCCCSLDILPHVCSACPIETVHYFSQSLFVHLQQTVSHLARPASRPPRGPTRTMCDLTRLLLRTGDRGGGQISHHVLRQECSFLPLPPLPPPTLLAVVLLCRGGSLLIDGVSGPSPTLSIVLWLRPPWGLLCLSIMRMNWPSGRVSGPAKNS